MTSKAYARQQQIAATILEQLGGNRFRAMTGARGFLSLPEGGLQFVIPTVNKINRVQIILTPLDLYDLKFMQIKKTRHDFKVIPRINCLNIYAGDLQRIFTATTGLDTTL